MTSHAAQYGTIPFDLFALEQWVYSLPPENDDRQWHHVVRQYLALTPRQRFPYHRASILLATDALLDDDESDTTSTALLSNLDPAKVTRVLSVNAGHQTTQERRISSLRCGAVCDKPLWVRTCYIQELEPQYEALATAAVIGGDDGEGSVDVEMVLDHVGRYDASLVGTSEEEVIAYLMDKIPGFCDGLQGSVIEDYPNEEELEADAEEGDLERASRRAAGLVYLVDREAVEAGIVKFLWLDIQGACVWKNKARPEQLMGLAGAFRGGYSLEEAVESHGLFGNPGE